MSSMVCFGVRLRKLSKSVIHQSDITYKPLKLYSRWGNRGIYFRQVADIQTRQNNIVNKHKYTYIYKHHSRFIPEGQQRHLRYSSKMPPFYHIYLAMKNTADVTAGKPITVWSQSISDVSAINPFTTLIEERERCYSFILFLTPHETW
jgi:hypothetical protein